ncbi:hypothetical protein ACLOJK_014573, partial [Asimina triloba]
MARYCDGGVVVLSFRWAMEKMMLMDHDGRSCWHMGLMSCSWEHVVASLGRVAAGGRFAAGGRRVDGLQKMLFGRLEGCVVGVAGHGRIGGSLGLLVESWAMEMYLHLDLDARLLTEQKGWIVVRRQMGRWVAVRRWIGASARDGADGFGKGVGSWAADDAGRMRAWSCWILGVWCSLIADGLLVGGWREAG